MRTFHSRKTAAGLGPRTMIVHFCSAVRNSPGSCRVASTSASARVPTPVSSITISIVPANNRSAKANASGFSSRGISRIDGAIVALIPCRSSRLRISNPFRLSKAHTRRPEAGGPLGSAEAIVIKVSNRFPRMAWQTHGYTARPTRFPTLVFHPWYCHALRGHNPVTVWNR